MRRRRALCVVAVGVLLVGEGALIPTTVLADEKKERALASPTRPLASAWAADPSGEDLRILIEYGNEFDAAEYNTYIAERIYFPSTGSLDDLLKYCGYEVSAREVELTTPDDLETRFGSDVVAVRFFAPKITDVSSPGQDLGWRKLVRLLVKSGSPADAKGISSMFLLFNIFQPRSQAGADPFTPCVTDGARCSQNSQAMLIVESPATDQDAAYWLVFERADKIGGKRTDHLTASFNGGDQSSGPTLKKYYVPVACAQCHGKAQATAKLNMLDTDHWHDRIQAGDDFADLGTAGGSALFDTPNDTTSPAFAKVFARYVTLNSEIKDQAVAIRGNDLQRRAAENWLTLHAANTAFLPVGKRGLPAPASDPQARVWTDSAADVQVLSLLNRYCYRCHSTVEYNVFDKEAVCDRHGGMASRVERRSMPEDRGLSPSVINDLAGKLRGNAHGGDAQFCPPR